MTEPVELPQIEIVLGIAEKYQDAMRRVNGLISTTQLEIKQRITSNTVKDGDLEVLNFIEQLLIRLKI